MKALTIRQPWASLIALGVKTIETRSWQTRYRGPIAIHAGAHPPKDRLRLGPGGPVVTAEWLVDATTLNTPHLLDLCNEEAHPLPLGAIVATANLLDVVPMVEASGVATFGPSALVLDLPHDGDLTHQHGGHWLIGPNNLTLGRPTRVDDQRHYGDFAPGRFAWLLADIVPCDPAPAKGKQGLWTWDGGAAWPTGT